MDVMTRQRRRTHLVEAEGVEGPEADAFLDVLARGLEEGAEEARALAGILDERLRAAAVFSGAAAALPRLRADEAFASEAHALLQGLSRTSPARATPGRARALQEAAARLAATRPRD